MGLFKKFGQWRKSRANQKQVRGQEKTIGNRICRFEPLEERRVMDAAPLYAGVVYIEEDFGSDLHGDTFEVSFTGGAAGTQLTRIIIDGDKGVPGYSSGDMIFDTIKEKMVDGKLVMTVGSDEAFPFQIVSATGIQSVIATVDDSGSKLILDFVGFDAGEKLIFSIDVDEIQDFIPGTTDPVAINDGVDPVASGAEFHNSLLTVEFKAEHYHDVTGTGQFKNKYDENFLGTGLPLSPDNVDGKRDRTTGAVVPLQQVPLPITIAGRVWLDSNLNLTQEQAENGIQDVSLTLWKKEGNTFVNTGISTTTNAQGDYLFGEEHNLMPGTYQVRETQPTGLFSVGAVPGQVAGSNVGSTVNGDPDVLTEITVPLGGQHAVHYNFGEAQAAQINGYVYHDRNNNGLKEAGEEGIPNATLQVIPINTISPQATITITTDANGFYQALNLAPGTYRVVEVQPNGWIDGLDAAGTVGGVVRGAATNPGDQIGTVALNGGDAGINYNFGELKTVEIHGRVQYTDRDGNCFVAEGPTPRPIEGAKVMLKDAQGNILATTFTNAAGEYSFIGLPPGTYTVVEETPIGLIDAGDHIGKVNGVLNGTKPTDAFGNVINDTIANIVLTSGQIGERYDFCETIPAQISGHVYHDRDNDGIREAGEEAIAGVVVRLYGSNGAVVAETTTNSQGYYQFTGLLAGTYQLVESQPAGWLDGKDAAGTIGGSVIGSAVNPGDSINQVLIKWGDTGINYDFGELLPGSIRGYVLGDKDFDCTYDEGEVMIAGVRMQLLDGNGIVVAETLTDANGEYYFGDLMPGNYSVRQIQPDGYFTQAEHIGQVTEDGLFVGPGSGSTTTNLLSNINIGSNQDLVNYYFCETTPAQLSGYVFIDGKPIFAPLGLSPNSVSLYSNGQLTADDTRLANVWLELRNGITGEPIDASQALPGIYPPGPIRVQTDANGYYQFTGLKAGNYAVFQIQPNGLIDGIDTPGTLNGIAINASDPLSPAVATLTVGHNNDAILRIALTPGANSQQNNFSEVQTYKRPPEEEPPLPPPQEFLPASVYSPPPMYPRNLPVYPEGPKSLYSSGGAVGYTWHLSVTNAGQPRGLREHVTTEATVWLTGVSLDQTALGSAKLQQGDWLMSIDPLTGKTVKRGFGMPGAIPIAGDFNGDGVAEMGVFYKGEWFVDLNGNGIWDKGDMWAKLGTDGDLPVVGDWDGDGKDDIGIFGPAWPGDPKAIAAEPGLPDPQNVPTGDMKNLPPKIEDATLGRRLLVVHPSHNRIRADLIDHVFHYGVAADKPVVGDWNGEGIRTIGVFRDGAWHLDMDGDGKFTPADKAVQFGKHGDIPVVGDWSGTGRDQLGVYRDGVWILDTNGNLEIDATDKVYELGGPGYQPVVGDWTGSGHDQIGVYRDAPAGPKDRIGSLPTESR